MADMVQFDLVCPERSLASGKASEVLIPGAEGELTAGPGHEPMLTTLRPGFLRAELEGGAQDFVVTHGFVEVSAESVSVIAERAFAAADVARPDLEAILSEARDPDGAGRRGRRASRSGTLCCRSGPLDRPDGLKVHRHTLYERPALHS